MEVLHKIDTRSSHQIIEVPKIFPVSVPQRLVESRPPQLAEQLVEVPTEPAYVLLVLASKVCSRPELRALYSGQGSTASGSRVVDNPVPQGRGGGGARGGLQGSRARQNSTANLGQIVDKVFQIFSQARVPQLPHRVVCVTMQMRLCSGFALFPVRKKARSWVRTRGRNCHPSRAHPRGKLMWTGMLQGEEVTSL